MKRLLIIFSLLLALTLLVACQSDDEEGTTPVAQATAVPPTPAPTPTPSNLVQGSQGLPWWNNTVFYEVFVRSFYDSDGDGIGDINGLIEKLDYLNDGDPSTTDDLGVTGIWLMPIADSPSYHGYDVVDYYQINPDYGTNEDFMRLMEEAHARGIRIIIDLVLNHTSRQHEFFQSSRDSDSQYRDWYIWAEENPGFRGPDGQQVWHRSGNSGYYYALFWDGMPDLNYLNPEVTEFAFDVSRFWLEEMGVDGFRLDAIKHLIEVEAIQENTRPTHDWFEAYYMFYKDVAPDALTVGEAWSSTQQVLEYTGDEVDIAFQFDLAQDILNAADVGIGTLFSKTMAEVVEAYPPGQYATFITNHDQNRVLSQLDGRDDAARVAASFLLTAPGVPFIYYGEEIGMQGTKPDEDIRRPMQWSSDSYTVGFTTGTPWRVPFSDYEERSVALQEADPASLLNHYRGLIQLRNEHEALRVGAWQLVEARPGRLYACLRYTEDQTLLIIINPSDSVVDDYTLTLESGPLSDPLETAFLFGDGTAVPPTVTEAGGFTDYLPLELAPFSTYIIELN